ncbi:MAG: efflux RND transporter periplasmic adaptor subunit [Legionella sp.]|nr:efflux RND transporter periplasmic adaptor subunit [Legionella sp.]
MFKKHRFLVKNETVKSRHNLSHLLWVLLLMLVLVVLAMMAMRMRAAQNLKRTTNEQAVPVVKTFVASRGPLSEEVILPGNVEAWHEATLYARTNGYVKQWYVDIGSRVKEGDLLAEIESPEIDAQLRQAEADVNIALANEELAVITAKRWQHLLKTNSVSQQETDEKVSTLKARTAAVIAAKANRDRLRELVSFERIIAPFDGVISLRSTDIGVLINAGSSASVRAMFRLVQTQPLRIYVQIPQTYADQIQPKMSVTLYFAEHPGKYYTAKLYKTADAIDTATRTLQAQFFADNPEGELLPGGYTEVHFKMPLSQSFIRLPVNALLFRSEGLQVGTVDENNTVVLKSIHVRRDFGTEVEVDAGLKVGETIILNPPDSLSTGQKVRLASRPSAEKNASTLQ